MKYWVESLQAMGNFQLEASIDDREREREKVLHIVRFGPPKRTMCEGGGGGITAIIKSE